jgi:hypothetical protein
LIRASKAKVRDRLYAKMISSSTTPYEREFIRLYLELREEKREKYRQKFLGDQAYFIAREYDNPETVTAMVESSDNA